MTGMTAAAPSMGRAQGDQGRRTAYRRGRADYRRRRREKLLAVLLLLVAFVVTVVLVGLQWLGGQATASSLPAHASHLFRVRC